MRIRFLPAWLGLVLFFTSPLGAQTTVVVEGRVIEERTGAPIPNAAVELEGAASALTTAAGTFRFERVLPGGYTLRVLALGYGSRDVFLVVRRDTSVVVELAVAPLPLDTLAVRSRTIDVRGNAKDVHSGRSLFRADVVTNLHRRTQTNTVGRFRLRDIPAGAPVVIGVRAFGYLPLDHVLVAEIDTTIVLEVEPDSFVQRMIDVEVGRLRKRAQPRLTAIMPVIDRVQLVRDGNGTVLDVLRSHYGPFLGRVRCILIDDEQRYNGLDELGLYLPEEFERIEVLERGRMLRLYTREFIKTMLGGGRKLVEPVFVDFGREPYCR